MAWESNDHQHTTPSEKAERLAAVLRMGNVGDAEDDLDVLGDAERFMDVSNHLGNVPMTISHAMG